MEPDACILCGECRLGLYYQDFSETYRSDYYKCENCSLICVPARHRPTAEQEIDRYDQHENDPEDERYRAFLGRLLKPMNEAIPPGSSGLDFGSGPGPTLHLMFEEQGHKMEIYDPFYADDPSVLEGTYDFITASEVVEHFHRPGEEFDRLWKCLRPGGYLGIMTKMAGDRDAFADWHYRLDDTHVAFYCRETFLWLAAEWNAEVTFHKHDVTIFRKKPRRRYSTGEGKDPPNAD